MNFQKTGRQKELIEWARGYALKELKEDAFEWEKKQSDEAFWKHSKKLAEQGFLGLNIAEEFGGMGLPTLDAMLVVEEIAKVCPYSANLIRNTMTGPVAFLSHLGTEEQKRKYVSPVVAGELTVAICMTEPEAGTASSDMTTSAVLDGEDYILNGNKIFITNGDKAEAFVVYARFPSGKGAGGIGAIIVDRDTEDFSVGQPIEWMGGYVYPIYLENARVPKENLVIPGNLEKAAYKKLMSTYNVERLGGLFELIGIAELALSKSIEYSKERKQFGKEINEFQAIQLKIADMAMRLQAARLLTYEATANVDLGVAKRKEVSMARVTTSEMVQYVTNEAIQIHGGYGLTKEYGLEWLYRITRHHSIAGGTSEIHRIMIASDLLGKKFNQRK